MNRLRYHFWAAYILAWLVQGTLNAEDVTYAYRTVAWSDKKASICFKIYQRIYSGPLKDQAHDPARPVLLLQDYIDRGDKPAALSLFLPGPSLDEASADFADFNQVIKDSKGVKIFPAGTIECGSFAMVYYKITSPKGNLAWKDFVEQDGKTYKFAKDILFDNIVTKCSSLVEEVSKAASDIAPPNAAAVEEQTRNIVAVVFSPQKRGFVVKPVAEAGDKPFLIYFDYHPFAKPILIGVDNAEVGKVEQELLLKESQLSAKQEQDDPLSKLMGYIGLPDGRLFVCKRKSGMIGIAAVITNSAGALIIAHGTGNEPLKGLNDLLNTDRVFKEALALLVSNWSTKDGE